MKANDIEIIIPAYNEESNIAEVIGEVRLVMGQGPRIIVVDDASEDKTSQIARGCGADVIRHPYRMGNGACIKTALRNANSEIVVTMDADGQHSAKDIPALISYLEEFDMAVGARDFKGCSLRNLANRFYNMFASYITGFKILDLTSGFRAVKTKSAAKFIYLFPNGFSYPTTITLAFLKTARAITYMPISCQPRRFGKSKIDLVGDGAKFFIIIIRIATFFSPLRVFLPVSIVFFICGAAYYLYTFVTSHRFTNMSVLLFTTSVLIFMLGLISEQISQLRMDKTEI